MGETNYDSEQFYWVTPIATVSLILPAISSLKGWAIFHLVANLEYVSAAHSMSAKILLKIKHLLRPIQKKVSSKDNQPCSLGYLLFYLCNNIAFLVLLLLLLCCLLNLHFLI